MRLKNISLEEILFVDIETVPLCESFEVLDQFGQHLWEKKTQQRYSEWNASEAYEKRAGIHAEFSRVIITGCGYFRTLKSGLEFRVKTFHHENEKSLLHDFSTLLNPTPKNKFKVLCAHNGKEFDFPFLCRRMLINGLDLPIPLDMAGKKPWEVVHLDTLELWKFGDRKHYTSLELMAYSLGIPHTKSEFDGSMVNAAYRKEGISSNLLNYCASDVVLLAQVFLKLRNEDLLTESQIVMTN